ncbi:LPXTG cell wall anchor domain-containing protein [Aeromicrobium duanguangcaii]|uniref:LPXTG cell wall anchor domain-containing protein n=1 Tax=Aeromicrobium duanguangcaii TaxID=2968086 RepID=A0ABY5KG30_9ACTN|nr:LPXTG cell wall anchor domain-containing protein [Aeromicrobium duanguangcaii]MCD9154533.1 LPXTG cell wall anchor domain-containing protein [Aeromicrobium duanguangcaii]MCL3838282.1 LPXTG cell wall anchor domain-containing protein [Aeromicrobium duanguangcaii]UUI68411.1 LPXTG cell wall anchor domain-containing protein [Aeromicrobium duanguangcaii]
MFRRTLQPLTFLIGLGALLVLALAGPASSEGYGDPVIVQNGGAEVVEPGETFTVSLSSNVECAWSSTFNGQTGPAAVGFDYNPTFTAPTEPGTYEGTVVCRYSSAGPFRPVAYSQDATTAAGRDQVISQTFTVIVDADAGNGDGSGAGTTGSAGDSSGALADTGGSNWELLAAGAGLLVVGGGVAIAARRRKS